jgi:hypothetical protein
MDPFATTHHGLNHTRNTTMSFQGYLRNITAKTGKTPADFRSLARSKGFTENGRLAAGVKAGAIVKWLKQDFQLGHGHAMAIYALLKGSKDENSP